MKEIVKKRGFLFNAGILGVALIFAKIIGAFYRIPLTNVIGEQGMGLYQLVFPSYAFMVVVLTSGFSLALTREVAKYVKRNEYDAAKITFKVAITFGIILSLFFTLVLCLIAPGLARFQGDRLLMFSYFVLAGSLIFTSLVSLYRGYLMGCEDVIKTGFSQIIEQFFKLVFGLSLSLLLIKHGISFAVIGACAGVVLSEVCTFLYFLLVFRIKHKGVRKRKKEPLARDLINRDVSKSLTSVATPESYINSGESVRVCISKRECFKSYFKVALPLTISYSIMPLIFMIDSIIIVQLLCSCGASSDFATTCYGRLYGIVNSLINMPVVLVGSIAMAAMPNLTKDVASGEHEMFFKKAQKAVFLVLFLSLFCMVVFASLAPEIVDVLYNTKGEAVKLTGMLLSLSSVSCVSLSLIQISGAVLQSKGNFWWQCVGISIFGIIKILLAVILAFLGKFNIVIVCALNSLCFISIAAFNIIKANLTLKKAIIKINDMLMFLFSSCLCLGLNLLLRAALGNINSFFRLCICGLTCLTVYLAIWILYKKIAGKSSRLDIKT